MPPEWFEEVRPLLKNGVQTIIEKVETDSNLPTQTFYQLSSGTLLPSASQFEVQAPGEFFEDKLLFDHFYEGELRKPAEIIFENLPDLPEDSTHTEGEWIELVERALFEFTGVVLNYAGEMRFDEVAFDLAFSEQFEPRFSDRVESRFLLLLKNTTIERGVSIDLEPDLQGTPDYLGPYGIQTLRIRALDELEETGIATFENPGSDVLNSVKQLDNSRPNPALEIVLHRRRPFREIAREFNGTEMNPWRTPEFSLTPQDYYPWQQLTDVIRYMATTIRRCLRLRYPRGVVGFEKGYAVSPGWETYRGISSRVTFELDFECPSTTTGTHITENRTSEVEQLWRSHRYQLRPDDVKFHNPLSRFEQMFSREAVEDQLIDCTVGCETTLLKGGTPGGNRYRLGLRAAALLSDENSLDWSPHQVGEFFRTLYTLRNDVVHDDKSLPDEPSSDEFIKLGDSEVLARPFLIYARMLYADVICSYLQLISTQDSSIQEINGQIDSIMLDQSSTVREQVFNPPDQ